MRKFFELSHPSARAAEEGVVDMGMRRRRKIWGTALGLALLAIAGCDGGGGAADGGRAVLPPTYKAREKEIGDAMVNAMKTQRARRGRKGQTNDTRRR